MFRKNLLIWMVAALTALALFAATAESAVAADKAKAYKIKQMKQQQMRMQKIKAKKKLSATVRAYEPSVTFKPRLDSRKIDFVHKPAAESGLAVDDGGSQAAGTGKVKYLQREKKPGHDHVIGPDLSDKPTFERHIMVYEPITYPEVRELMRNLGLTRFVKP